MARAVRQWDYNSSSYRTYNNEPRHLEQPFREHVRATGQPETFPGVHMGQVAKTEFFTILTEFTVEPTKRPDGKRAPCPMCQHEDHYLKGALVYFPRLKVVAPIGHECADKKNLRAAKDERKRQKDKDLELDFLFQQLPLLDQRRAWIGRARDEAESATRVYRAFKGRGGEFHKVLRGAIKQSAGTLVVHEVVWGEMSSVGPAAIRSEGGVQTKDVVYGQLSGDVALLANYAPLAELDAAWRTLGDVPCGSGEDEVLDYITALSDTDRRALYLRQRDGYFMMCKFLDRLENFMRFFDPENLNRISHWAAHPESPLRFRASVETLGSSGRFFVIDGDKSSFKVHLPTRFEAGPKALGPVPTQ